MGQANSRDSANDRRPPARSTLRPLSWAASHSLTPPSDSDDASSAPELLLHTPPSSSSTSAQLTPAPSSRSASSLRFNPFNRLSSDRSDAGSSASASASSNNNNNNSNNNTRPTRQRSRITRARSSLSTSIPNLFHRSARSRETASSATSSAFALPPAAAIRRTPYGSSPFLPRFQPPTLDLDFDDLPSPPTAGNRLRRLSSWRDRRSSLLLPALRSERGIRSMTDSLRRRRSRSPLRRGEEQEDQVVLLSRLLSYAAEQTALSLIGGDAAAVSEARNINMIGDGEDGTFDSFLQALSNGRIASALRQAGNEGDDESGGEIPAPLSFFRMFRFGSAFSPRNGNAQSEGQSSSDNPNGEDDADGRMVPIIIVGIRSISPRVQPTQEPTLPHFMDALSNLPPPLASPRDGTIDDMLRQPQNSTHFAHRRRASMGGLNTFPSNYDAQRHHRYSERPRPWSTFTDSPSGPLPPPSTPASSGLSAVSSGAATPALSASPPSPGISSAAPSRRGSFARRATRAGLEPTAEEPHDHQQTPRQRRLSESDFARFGSGASRRNGVVEPDHNPGEGSRSWIIYVLGGSYPENHPILTTPSIFSDSPTYEDMILLSNLMGPVKPPVATEDDVEAAGGIYTIRDYSGRLYAQGAESNDMVEIGSESRCLVCLCDYEVREEARKLIKCGHLFHKICIDQWLTTGRNSCPLCRGQGVDEKTPSSSEPDHMDIPEAHPFMEGWPR